MPHHSPHVVVVGSNMIDLVCYLDALPGAGETLVGRGFAQNFGGKGANQAAMAALMGARVSFVSCIGDDAFGASWPDHLKGFGIDARHLAIAKGHASGVASIWVESSGENRIVLAPGANAALSPAHVDAAFDKFDAVDVVLSQLETPQSATARAFELGHALGAQTILNPAPAVEIAADVLAATDWLLPNESELRMLAGHRRLHAGDEIALIRLLGEALNTRVVVTRGEGGAAYCRSGETTAPILVAAPRVVPVDTTGAGDAFAGAFAVAIGRSLDAAAAMRTGVAVASHSVTQRGTTASYPRGEALREILEGASAG